MVTTTMVDEKFDAEQKLLSAARAFAAARNQAERLPADWRVERVTRKTLALCDAAANYAAVALGVQEW